MVSARSCRSRCEDGATRDAANRLADGVTGTVEVMLTVRALGAVVGAEAISGPALLRRAAVDAALATTFVPEIRDCHPIPGAYSYFVDFSGA